MNALIEGKQLKRYYHRGAETVKALDGVDISIYPSEMVSILGPSGSGKTTLINVLSCLDAPTAGELIVAGKSVTGLSEDALVEVRRGVLGFVFQQFHLLPTLTVTENVELPLTFLRRPIDRKKTLELLALVGLSERAGHLPRELSGGQMQRTAIARSLMIEPKILVADEPTGNLDKASGGLIFELFRKLARDKGLAQLTILGIKLKDFNSFKLREFENRWLRLPEVQVVGLQQVKNTLIGLVATAQTMIAAVALIAVLVALLGVVNAILMSVYERTGEIGIMKALGARRGDIFQLVWLETLIICLAGSLVGSAVAIVGSDLVERAIRSLADFGVAGSIVSITPSLIGYAVLISVVLGFFAGLYPAWRAASMRPVQAIREGAS